MDNVRIMDVVLRAYRLSGLRGFRTLHGIWSRLSGSPYIRVKSLHGILLEIMPAGYVEKFVMKHGFYESEVFDAVNLFLEKDAVFWDIGANLGLHAVTAKSKHPAAVVVAFEPVPKLRDRIRANACLNGVEFEIAGMALSNFSGQANLYVPDGDPGGLASLKESRDDMRLRITVECRRADGLIQSGKFLPPTVIKLDVEGSEYEVLEGFGEYLHLPSLQAIIFEGAPGLEHGNGNDPVADLLCAAGFTLQRLRRKEPTSHPLENYLARR